MVAVPAATPETIPDVTPTLAIRLLLLVQLPLPVASASVIAEPTQTLVKPDIAAGNELTVTTAVAAHVVGNVYEIIEVPDVTPVTTPVLEPIVATVLVVLLHVPPLVASDNVVVVPGHRNIVPVIAAGSGLITTVALPVIVLVHNVVVFVPITV